MNEMRLSTGFMNDVTSLFVPKLCLDNHDKVAVANGPTHKQICRGLDKKSGGWRKLQN